MSMDDTCCINPNDEQSIVDTQEFSNIYQNAADTNIPSASSLDQEDTNEKVRKILVEQVSSDWIRFAYLICLIGFYNIIEEIHNENNNNQLKIKIFLQRITETNQLNYNEVIANSLNALKRFDILLCVALDEKFAKVTKFLIEHLSTDWKRFAYKTHLKDIEFIVEDIDLDYDDDKSKMASLLEQIFKIDPLQYKYIIGNSLIALGKFDILFGVALDENDETVQRILVENVSADWKRLAFYTCLHGIDSVVKQIDCGYSNDQSKMAAFLNQLYKLDPFNYKKLIINFLNVTSRFDVLFRIGLVESSEIIMKLLLERVSSDWKRFVTYASFYEVNCIIENIDRGNNSNQMKMTALLEKLYDINPLQFKELITSTLITMKRFCVLSAFEDGCHGTEKEEKKTKKQKQKQKVKEEMKEEPVLINENIEKEKILIKRVSPDWKKFAFNTCLNNIYSIIEQIDLQDSSNELKMADFLQKLYEINPSIYKEVIASSLFTLKRFDILLEVAMDKNFEKVHHILVKRISTNWRKFARQTGLNDIDTIVEHIDHDYEDDESKMSSLLKKLFEICPLNYKVVIAKTLNALERFDILFGVALSERYETIRCILIERVSSDWKRFARATSLNGIDGIVEYIDHDYEKNQCKIDAFLERLHEIRPIDYKDLIEMSLNATNRYDILLGVALDKNFESIQMKLLERLPPDWKTFAYHTCLHEVDCVIEHIDHDNNNNETKLMEFLKRLHEIAPFRYKEIIKSSLITLKRFSVLLAIFDEEVAKEETCQIKGNNSFKQGKKEEVQKVLDVLNNENALAKLINKTGKEENSDGLEAELIETRKDIIKFETQETQEVRSDEAEVSPCLISNVKHGKYKKVTVEIQKVLDVPNDEIALAKLLNKTGKDKSSDGSQAKQIEASKAIKKFETQQTREVLPEAAGVNQSVIRKLKHGKYKKVTEEVQKVLDVPNDEMALAKLINKTGKDKSSDGRQAELIEARKAIIKFENKQTQKVLADAAGVNPNVVSKLKHGKFQNVTVEVQKVLDVLSDENAIAELTNETGKDEKSKKS